MKIIIFNLLLFFIACTSVDKKKLNDEINNAVKHGNYDKAIVLSNKYIEIDQTAWETYYLRGLSYYFKKNVDSAIIDFNKGISLKKRFPWIVC